MDVGVEEDRNVASGQKLPLLSEFDGDPSYASIPPINVSLPNKRRPCSKHRLLLHQIAVVVLTTGGHMLYQSGRKALSTTKGSFIIEWTPQDWLNTSDPDNQALFQSVGGAEAFLGLLDSLFLIGYALTSIIVGRLGDYMDARGIFVMGMWICGVFLMLFGCVPAWAGFEDRTYYCLTYFGFGLGSGFGKTVAIRALADWFKPAMHGFIVGLFALSEPLGRIVGAFLSAAVLQYGTECVYLAHSSLLLVGGVVVWFGLLSSPAELGVQVNESEAFAPLHRQISEFREPEAATTLGQRLWRNLQSTWKVLLLPGVIPYALSYAGVKMVNYGLMFWLPFYLESRLRISETEADNISTWFDVGGIPGTLIVGLAWDRIPGGRNFIEIGILVATAAISIITINVTNVAGITAVLFFFGLLHWAVFNAEGAIASTSLGLPEDDPKNEAVSTVTGITNGFAGLAAAAAVFVIALLQEGQGWDSIFYLFCALNVYAALCLIPLAWVELKNCGVKSASREESAIDDDGVVTHEIF